MNPGRFEPDGALVQFYHDWRDGECIHPDDGLKECEDFAAAAAEFLAAGPSLATEEPTA